MSEFGKEVEDYFCRFTFGQFVTLILLELVTLFFVFYLGARYGPDLIGGRKEVAAQPPVGLKPVGNRGPFLGQTPDIPAFYKDLFFHHKSDGLPGHDGIR